MSEQHFLDFFEDQIRQNNLKTLEEIADRVQLSISTVSRIRSGKTPPSDAAIRQIAAAFGRTKEEALGMEAPICAGAEAMKDLMGNFERRIAERQKELEAAMKRIDEKDARIESLEKDIRRYRSWTVASIVALVVLLVVAVCILAYDLTHLDHGWFVGRILRQGVQYIAQGGAK